MRRKPRVGAETSEGRSGFRVPATVVGLALWLAIVAAPAVGSPLRGPRVGARWAAWELRHNAAWTARTSVRTAATRPTVLPRFTPYQRHWLRAEQRVTTPGSVWDRYFSRALAAHQMRVRGPNAVRALAVSQALTGALPQQSAFVQYLMWRRSLDPTRFDYYHRRLGVILAQKQYPSIPPSVGAERITPPPVAPPLTPPSNPPDTPQPPQVPEPSTLAIAVVLIASGVWARRRGRAWMGVDEV